MGGGGRQRRREVVEMPPYFVDVRKIMKGGGFG